MKHKLLAELSHNDLLSLVIEYDNYIYNNGEEWDRDRQPVSILEFYNNEFMEELQKWNLF